MRRSPTIERCAGRILSTVALLLYLPPCLAAGEAVPMASFRPASSRERGATIGRPQAKTNPLRELPKEEYPR